MRGLDTNHRRRLVATVVACAALSAALSSAPTADAQPSPPEGVRWLSVGDSYSSGEGVWGNAGDCAMSDQAYGPSAQRHLDDAYEWDIAQHTFAACTGHLVEDMFNARGATSQWDWHREQGGAERVDVITMSYGGNDIGFADTMSDCVLVARDNEESFWRGWAPSGCDVAQLDLTNRIDWLVDPIASADAPECAGFRRDRTSSWECPLRLEGRAGSLPDFYWDLATNHLTSRGRLVVVGYPRLFAPTSEWRGYEGVMCSGVLRGDAERLNEAADRLNTWLELAVRRANDALGEERVVYVDTLDLYRSGNHELCGWGVDWMNGLSTRRDDSGQRRTQTSFHPKAAGHAATAELVASRLDATFPRTMPLAADQLASAPVPEMCGHPPGTLVDGELPGIEPGYLALERGPGVEPVLADVDGDGADELVAVFGCTHGGVGHPPWIAVFDPGPRPVAAASMEMFDTGSADREPRGYITKLSAGPGGSATVEFVFNRAGDAGCCGSLPGSATVQVRDGEFIASNVVVHREEPVVQAILDAAVAGDVGFVERNSVDPAITWPIVEGASLGGFGSLQCVGPLSTVSWRQSDWTRTCRTTNAFGSEILMHMNWDGGRWVLTDAFMPDASAH